MEHSVSSMRLLVIGADEHFRYLVRRYSEQAELEVVFAFPGVDALETVQRQQPAVIMIEVDQPADSLALLHALKASPTTAHIPVVLCSWFADTHAALLDGAAACLQKPILYEAFQRTMAAVGSPPSAV